MQLINCGSGSDAIHGDLHCMYSLDSFGYIYIDISLCDQKLTADAYSYT